MQQQITQWRKRHPYLLPPASIISWLTATTRETLAVVFATWPSMHDPISNLLNAPPAEADRLTERWTDAKLKELNYVGISSALITGTIASAFSWYSLPADPWSTSACWLSALVLALTAISLATQQTISLTRLCSGENGSLKVRQLLGEDEGRPCDRRRHLERSGLGSPHRHEGSRRVRMKKSQLWIWQTPVMLSNFAILLFVIGLMISVFGRAMKSRRDWTKGDLQIAIFFGCASIFAGSNYLFCWLCLNQGSLELERKVERVKTERSGNPSIVF